MIADEVRIYQHTHPFEPFVIHLADGRYFDVLHPDNAVLGPKDRTVSVLNTDKLIEIVNVLHVVSIRPLKRSKAKR
jgi:hypothetical protein